MKKIFLSLSLLLGVVATSVYANDDPGIGEEVLSSFQKEFSGAESVVWKTQEDYFKATFILGNHRTVAFFNKEGQLEGSIRSIFYNELPLAVITAVNKKFTSQPDVLDINEVNNSTGNYYRITLVNAEKKYRFRVDATGDISDIEKLKK